MSELINNRALRQQKLKELILKLHDNADFDEVKKEFEAMTMGVSASEITEMEQALVDEGMPVENIQRLCDVHAAVFKGSIADIHAADVKKEDVPGHPVAVFKDENRAVERLLEGALQKALEAFGKLGTRETRTVLEAAVGQLLTIDTHYRRKENLLFPLMEKYGITAPPQVMWGVDDEIREKIKGVLAALKQEPPDAAAVAEQADAMINQVSEMIFKEEQIMFPMTLEAFSDDDWASVEAASDEFGYTLIGKPVHRVKQAVHGEPAEKASGGGSAPTGQIARDTKQEVAFDAGALTAEEVNAILNTIPVDMTFVGADNKVKYFSQGKERIFQRPLTIIGREVKHCHPPKSVHIVEQIVADLRCGKKDHEDFWIHMGETFVYIRYFAVRSKSGEFLGVLEFSQDIKPITELEGEKRLMS